MSIRTRIALLALVAISSVVAALYAQYRSIDAEVQALRRMKTVYAEAQMRSGLVHVLQKERGLSSALLANPSAERRAELHRQYAVTDAILSGMHQDELAARIAAVRTRVAGRTISWPETRRFYTDNINAALDTISRSVISESSHHTAQHSAIVELAWARESMGLLRATINGIYSRDASSLGDVTYLAAEFGKFNDHLHAFRRGHADAAASLVAPYGTVVAQIEDILQQGPHKGWHRSNARWWAEATQVIDNFKAQEDALYGELLHAAEVEIAAKEIELHRYALTAIGFGLAVALLTAFTILRILHALGVLISTLDNVVRSENYSLRIRGESPRDEFGRISLSLNKLLDFTDSLLSDKEKLASTDLLTGVMNRRRFIEMAAQEVNRSSRYHTPFVLIFIDIDHFKQVNDSFGHATGDQVLVYFSHLLNRGMRGSDLLARWGGEEFVILAPQTRLDQGFQLAEKLCLEVSSALFIGPGRVTCSMGVAEHKPGESFDAMWQRADAALYEAKESGRNRVCKAR